MEDPFALPAFVIALIGLVFGVVGALTGIVSLGWQIVTRRRGAHNVRVSVTAAPVTEPEGSISDWQVCVSPSNVGATAVQITGWRLEMPNKRGTIVQTLPVSASTRLPHLLEPGTKIGLYWPQEHVRLALARHAADLKASDLRAFVHLGTGKTVRAKERGVPA